MSNLTKIPATIKAGLISVCAFAQYTYAGVGADAAGKVDAAGIEAQDVYVAVIGCYAAYFVVRLIKRAL